MAKLICKIKGSRGRIMSLYDTKCVIETKVSIGSVLSQNATDGEKTIFLADVQGIQFKRSGFTIGYLQLETSSMQMNNKNSNFFSENTFTFEDGRNNVTNELIEEIYSYICDRVEELKYGVKIIDYTPSFNIIQDDDDEEYEDDDVELENSQFEETENTATNEYEDISDFYNLTKKTSTDDLELILQDQRDLYNDEEIEIIENELKNRYK